MPRRRRELTALCALALICLTAFAGCGKVSNKPGETVGEGLSTPLDGLRYTVFLTRQLNLALPEDKGYLPGHKEAPPGKGLYGVFLQACNKGKSAVDASNSFYIEDAQGDRFTPETLHVYDSGQSLCTLCAAATPAEPVKRERIRARSARLAVVPRAA